MLQKTKTEIQEDVEEKSLDSFEILPTIRLWLDGVNKIVAAKALTRIEKKYGHISPEHIIQESRNPKHPFHKLFEWDDTKAAEKYRLLQAKFIQRAIGYILVNKTTGERTGPIPAVHLIKRGEAKYTGMLNALADEPTRADILKKAASELESWKQRYGHLVEFVNVVRAMNVEIPRVKKKR
jgi:hypothetical protein